MVVSGSAWHTQCWALRAAGPPLGQLHCPAVLTRSCAAGLWTEAGALPAQRREPGLGGEVAGAFLASRHHHWGLERDGGTASMGAQGEGWTSSA